MAKKKSESKVDRTQIYVALIGLIGTIVVALIAAYANKPASNTPVPATATAATAVTPQNGGLCLEDYFSSINADNRLDLDLGVSTRISVKKDDVFGLRLFDGKRLLAELQFTATSNTKSFKVVSVIDGNCTQVFDYGNLDRPDAKGAIENWENLGLSLPDGKYRIRMGWYSGNQIELLFASNQ